MNGKVCEYVCTVLIMKPFTIYQGDAEREREGEGEGRGGGEIRFDKILYIRG